MQRDRTGCAAGLVERAAALAQWDVIPRALEAPAESDAAGTNSFDRYRTAPASDNPDRFISTVFYGR
jgi:hypothetical protein